MSNTTNYGWAYVHPTLGIGLTRGPENSITFQNSPTADIDSNGMGQASGSVDLTFDSTTKVLTLAGSAAITDTGTTTALMVKQTGTGDIFTVFDNTTEVFTILDGGNVGINKTNPGYKLEVNGDGYFETNLTVNGDLTVNGTNTIVNSTTIELDDKNIELAKGVGNDAAVNGGGITLISSDGNKTITYDNLLGSWDFSEHVRVANGKKLYVDEVSSRDTSGLILQATQGNVEIKATADNGDVIVTVDDGGTDFVALTIDGSDNGSALFTPRDGGFLKVDDGGADGFTKIRNGRLEIERNSDDPAIDPFLVFRRSRGTESSKALAQDGDDLGSLIWYGYDGGTERSGDYEPFGESAAIVVEADADHGSTGGVADTTDSPGRIKFQTTADGADTSTVRMVIKSDGKVGIGTSTPSELLEVNGTVKGTAIAIGSTTVDSTELGILEGATVTTAELNTLDGDTAATSTTLADADRVVVNDNGTMKQVALTDFETYFESALDTLPNVTSVGTLLALDVQGAGANQPTINLNGGEITLTKATDTPATAPALMFKKSRGTISGGETKIVDGDTLGTIGFSGWDGNSSFSAGILGLADGEHGSGAGTGDSTDSPGKLVFKTTPDGSDTLVERMVIKSDGKIGIGTTTPQRRLHVHQANSALHYGLTIRNNQSGEGLQMGNNADGSSFINNNEATKGGLHLGGAGAAYNDGHIFISGSGKVGIGTTSPSTALDVNGTVTATVFDGNLVGNVTGNSATATSASFAGVVTTAAQPNITSLGNLTGLTVADGNIQLSNGYQIQWGDSETAIFGNATSDYIRLKTAGLDRVAVDSAGNLGIGTIAPESKLHVYSGDAGVAPSVHADDLVVEGSESTGISILTPNNQVGRLYFGDTDNPARAYVLYDHSIDMMKFSVASANRLIIDNTGNVGIGVPHPESPDTILHAVGDSGLTIEETGATGRKLVIEPPTAATVGTIRTHDTGAGLLLKSFNAGNQMFLKDDGNVGIGMTVPNAKLTVEGAISFDQLAPADVPAHTTGYGKLYVKPDNCLYFKDANGAEANLVLEDGFKAHRLIEGDVTSHVNPNINDLLLTDYFVSVKTVANGNSAHGSITVRLPDPSGNAGKSYMIKDIGGHAGSGTPQTVTVTSAGGASVEGLPGGHVFDSSDSAIGVYTDGNNWFIF